MLWVMLGFLVLIVLAIIFDYDTVMFFSGLVLFFLVFTLGIARLDYFESTSKYYVLKDQMEIVDKTDEVTRAKIIVATYGINQKIERARMLKKGAFNIYVPNTFAELEKLPNFWD